MTAPIFDSLTHPMPGGDWLEGRLPGQNTIESLLAEMDGARVDRALAVGLGPDVGGYREESYAGWVRESSPRLVPIAYCSPSTLDAARAGRLTQLGYAGVKLHPRLGGFGYGDPALRSAIDASAAAALPVLLCTFPYARDAAPDLEPSDLAALLRDVSGAAVVLVHGGGPRLLEFMEVANPHPAVLVDVSLTICRYSGSSLDQDLAFLFRRFDQRVCVGSDSPEYPLEELRQRFDLLTDGLDPSKVERVASGNLARLFGSSM